MVARIDISIVLDHCIGAAVLLVFLLYGVEPVRRTLKKMPSWKSVGITLKRSLGIA